MFIDSYIFGYSFNFKDTSFELFYNSECVGNDILSDGLYLLGLQNYVTYSSMHVKMVLKGVILMRIPLCYDTED